MTSDDRSSKPQPGFATALDGTAVMATQKSGADPRTLQTAGNKALAPLEPKVSCCRTAAALVSSCLLPPLVLADSRTAEVQSDPLPDSTAPKISRSVEAGLAVCG